jgi:hypothetical protein
MEYGANRRLLLGRTFPMEIAMENGSFADSTVANEDNSHASRHSEAV